MMLRSYDEFAACVDELGFLTLSENPAGWPSVGAMTDSSRWFTDDRDTDPWQWRIRIVDEGRAAYAKVFHGMPSFISREWYPAVIAARRGGQTAEDLWELGLMREEAWRIYGLFDSRDVLATHEIKRLCGFTGKSKGRFDAAMTALQAGMFLTASGMTRMTTMEGRPYSWPVTEYRRIETWAWPGTMEQASAMGSHEARDRIAAHMLAMEPNLNTARVGKFIAP